MDWVFSITDSERVTGAFGAERQAQIADALRRNGCLVLRGAVPLSTIDAMRAEFDSQCGVLGLSGLAARAAQPPPRPVLNVGDKRFEIAPRMIGALASSTVLASPLIHRFLTGILSTTMRLSGFTFVVSYPGATAQHVHRDHAHLFTEPGAGTQLPCYAVNVAIPLVDVDSETGPTGVWPGSHRASDGTQPLLNTVTTIPLARGDCLLLDYRTLHVGLPNRSQTVRPIAYLVYARTWFFDELNHTTRTPLDMTIEDYRALPDSIRPLLMRVYTQHMRTEYLRKSALT
ncbi:MAG: phytanoyl-CoA dioxygenase family protein [Rhizomicrobium sp.]